MQGETVEGGKGAGPCEDLSLKKSTMDGGREERTWGKGIRQRKGLFFSPASAVENVDEKREGQEKEKYLMEQDGCKRSKGKN